MFCLGDSTASLFGGLISTSLPFNKGKTWEGSLAGFFFAFLAGTFFVSPWLALVGAAIAMTIEVLPLPVKRQRVNSSDYRGSINFADQAYLKAISCSEKLMRSCFCW